MRTLLCGLTLLVGGFPCANAQAGITNLRCEYLAAPLGIDTTEPRFTWEYTRATDPGFRQTAASVEISTDSLFSPSSEVFTLSAEGDEMRVKPATRLPLKAATRYFWRVTAKGEPGAPIVSPTASFETGKLSAADWNASWISDGRDKTVEEAPAFSKSFNLSTTPAEGRAYVSATGYYDLTINGKRVGNLHMDPAFTDYTKRSLYTVHDITGLLKQGENTITVTLGNGFANCQMLDAWNQQNAPWRDRPRFICEITADGTTVAATDTSWTVMSSPVIYNNIYSGEHIDNRVSPEVTGKAIVAGPHSPILANQSTYPIRPTESITPHLIYSEGDTVFCFDAGKNIAGVCEISLSGEEGTVVTVAHGELLKKSGRLEQGNLNIYYHPMKSDEAFQTDRYILAGNGNETFRPQFNYHGFRYIELRAEKPVKVNDITALKINTDLPRIGHFSSSSPLLDKIYAATMLSYEDNLHSIPTDCPQREKNGWTADAHVAMPLALLNYDGITFYEKWMNDFIDNQLDNGNISGIIPSPGWGYGDSPGPVWDAALFIVPVALYDFYGDPEAIERLYPTMLRYLGWLESLRQPDGTLTCGIGDWLPYSTQTPTDFTSTLYAYVDYKLMERIASILGKDPKPFADKAEEMRNTVNNRFFNPDTKLYANGSQAAQGIALYWDVADPEHRQAVADNLNRMVAENGYALDFGLLGSKSVMRMLTKYGHIDTAWRMATRCEAPSWGHWVEENGYTTLAETWTLSPEFRDASLNHVFMGDIAAWMTNDIAGINFDPENPGFKNVIIRPHFPSSLDHAQADYQSVRGRIASSWKRNPDGSILLTVEIPANTSATLQLPSSTRSLPSGVSSIVLTDNDLKQ